MQIPEPGCPGSRLGGLAHWLCAFGSISKILCNLGTQYTIYLVVFSWGVLVELMRCLEQSLICSLCYIIIDYFQSKHSKKKKAIIPVSINWCFPGGANGKKPDCQRTCLQAGDVRDMGLIPVLGRSPVGGPGNLLQYSCLESPMDRRT